MRNRKLHDRWRKEAILTCASRTAVSTLTQPASSARCLQTATKLALTSAHRIRLRERISRCRFSCSTPAIRPGPQALSRRENGFDCVPILDSAGDVEGGFWVVVVGGGGGMMPICASRLWPGIFKMASPEAIILRASSSRTEVWEAYSALRAAEWDMLAAGCNGGVGNLEQEMVVKLIVAQRQCSG